jgi:hypothetical protein
MNPATFFFGFLAVLQAVIGYVIYRSIIHTEETQSKFRLHSSFHTIVMGIQQSSTHAELDFWGNEASLLFKIYHKKVPEMLLTSLATELAAAIRVRTTEGFTK